MDSCSQTKVIDKNQNINIFRPNIAEDCFHSINSCEICLRYPNKGKRRVSFHNSYNKLRIRDTNIFSIFKFNFFIKKLFIFYTFVSVFAVNIETHRTSIQLDYRTHYFNNNRHDSFINETNGRQTDTSVDEILANYTINDTANIVNENDIKSVDKDWKTSKKTSKSAMNINETLIDSDISINVNITNIETEYCDLVFINEEDKRNANNGFMAAGNDAIAIRDKRSILKPKTIETAIFIDRHLHQRFSKDLIELKRLVMAIMSEVQLIYNFRTMKTAIRIVIVRFEVLPLSSNTPDDANGDIDKYLDNFCEWQSRRVRHEPRDKRWDHAIMLTGLDLFKDNGNGKKNRKVLGLAWVNGMCKPQYSCTLNEGKSFEAAFVIAHEMGHSLGILHDNRNNNCDGDKYIMSEKTGPGKIHWSSCSNAYLETFLKKGHGMCLENVAVAKADLDYTKSHRLPGEQYPPDLQCRLALGAQYKAYRSPKSPFDDICRELWCLAGNWVTPAHPALEGSVCGSDNKRCIQGECGGLGNQQKVHKVTETRRQHQMDNNKSSSSRRAIIRTLRTGRNRFVVKRKRKSKSINVNSSEALKSNQSKQTVNAAVVPVRTAPVIDTVMQRFQTVFKSMSDGVKTVFTGLG